MKFERIEKIHEGRFISFYNAIYRTATGKQKIYEMISRDGTSGRLMILGKTNATR